MNDVEGHPVPRMRLFVQITQSYLLNIYHACTQKQCVRLCIYNIYMLHIVKRLLSPLKVDERRTTIRIRAHRLNRNAEVVVVGSID